MHKHEKSIQYIDVYSLIISNFISSHVRIDFFAPILVYDTLRDVYIPP